MIRFDRILSGLLDAYGPQGWWPADSVFEIMVGALLVQRTTWRNAASAIAQLEDARLLDPKKLALAPIESIRRCVRCAGFFRTKATRLRQLARFVVAQGGTEGLAALPTPELRGLLLNIDGVGPETADAILLYGFGRPVAVVDEYLRRLCQRLLAASTRVSDDDLRAWSLAHVSDSAGLAELHALVIRHGRERCVREPRCESCGIRAVCRTGRE